METVSRDQCLIYDGPPSKKLTVLAGMIRQKLDGGYRCLYLNSAPMVAGIRSYLSAIDMNVAEEIAKASLILSSELTTGAKGFDVDLMLFKLEDTLDQALMDGYKGLWATGDMTWEFGPERDFTKLLEYEHKLEELFRRRPQLSGICQYHRETMPHHVMRQGLLTHQTIFINETLSSINPYYVHAASPGPGAKNGELDELLDTLCWVADSNTDDR